MHQKAVYGYELRQETTMQQPHRSQHHRTNSSNSTNNNNGVDDSLAMFPPRSKGASIGNSGSVGDSDQWASQQHQQPAAMNELSLPKSAPALVGFLSNNDNDNNNNNNNNRSSREPTSLVRRMSATTATRSFWEEWWGSMDVMFQHRATWLVLVGPIAVLGQSTGWLGEAACFCLAGAALIPCAERLSFATEQVAAHTNGTVGALLNATFGNAPELLIAVAALRSGYYRMVQLAMLGSILTNLILVFGVSCVIGGLRWQVQEIRIVSGSVSTVMLLVATAGSLFPTVLVLSGQLEPLSHHYYDPEERPPQQEPTMADDISQILVPSKEEVTLCRVNAAVMLILYIFYLIFQLGTHKDEFDDEAPKGVLFKGNNNNNEGRARRNLFCLRYWRTPGSSNNNANNNSRSVLDQVPAHRKQHTSRNSQRVVVHDHDGDHHGTSPVSTMEGIPLIRGGDHSFDSILVTLHNGAESDVGTAGADELGISQHSAHSILHPNDDNMNQQQQQQQQSPRPYTHSPRTKQQQRRRRRAVTTNQQQLQGEGNMEMTILKKLSVVVPQLPGGSSTSLTGASSRVVPAPPMGTTAPSILDLSLPFGTVSTGSTLSGAAVQRSLRDKSKSSDAATSDADEDDSEQQHDNNNRGDGDYRKWNSGDKNHNNHHQYHVDKECGYAYAMDDEDLSDDGLDEHHLKQHQQQQRYEQHPSTLEHATSDLEQNGHEAPVMSMRVGVLWLFLVTIVISAMSDLLVDSIDGFAQRMKLSEVFTSMIIIPFFSNVAEQVSAFLFAYRDEMDLCVGVTVGSAIQIATFVLPGAVLIGYALDRNMTLYFHAYETAILLFAVLVVAAILQGGTTNWMVGSILVGIYVMFAAGIWFHETEDLTIDAENFVNSTLFGALPPN